MQKKIVKFIVSILICQISGLIGLGFTSSAIPLWYNALNKPSFNPPPWIFGPVWTILYIMMGIALFLMWTKETHGPKKQKALRFFSLQLFLNAIWSPIFFGLRSPFLAFITIIFLWVSILLTLIYSYKLSKTATGLLIPYFAWVSFAAILNFSIWKLNG